MASDISEPALAVARRNARECVPDQTLEWVHTDGLQGLDAGFDLIVCNPPYIGWSERPTLDPEVAHHDPELALFSGDDGTRLDPAIDPRIQDHLSERGWLLMEHGHQQGDALRARSFRVTQGFMTSRRTETLDSANA